jgi:hypothetical protein
MSRHPLSTIGLVVLGTGALGALSALVLIFWPAQVPEGPLSYPFTTTGFVLAQAWFFVHHFGLVLALVGLVASGAVGASRLARGGAWVAGAGMVLLTLAELLAMRYADWDADAANAGLMGATYGVAVTTVGLGLLVAGVAAARAGIWSGWHAWTPLAIGVAAFAVVTPGMFGGFVVARLAIGFWMLLFGALGYALFAEARRSSAAVAPPAATPVG